MNKLVKNERGSSIIEMILVIAIMSVLLVFIFGGMRNSISDMAGKAMDNVEIEIVQEDTPVENTISDEELTKGFAEVVKVLGILLGIGLLLTISGFLIRYLIEVEKRGPQTIEETLRFMIRKKPERLFTLVKGNVEHHEYQYTIQKYQWFLESTTSEIDLKMNRKDKRVLHITYDKKNNTYTRKNIKGHVFSDEKTLKYLDKLVSLILSTQWNERLTFNVISDSEDLSQELPLPVTAEEHVIITDPMLELEAYVENIIEDLETKELFQEVIENMHALREFHTELDIETKHIIEYSLTNDLNRLLTLYEDLNEDQKEMLATEIQKRLHLMNEKVNEIKSKVDKKKANEIKKALHLFDKRYGA